MTTETGELPELASRVARLEGAYERVDRQLDSLDRRVENIALSVEQLRSDMNEKMDSLRAEISNHRSETNSRFDSLHREIRIMTITLVTLNLGGLSIATAVLAAILR